LAELVLTPIICSTTSAVCYGARNPARGDTSQRPHAGSEGARGFDDEAPVFRASIEFKPADVGRACTASIDLDQCIAGYCNICMLVTVPARNKYRSLFLNCAQLKLRKP